MLLLGALVVAVATAQAAFHDPHCPSGRTAITHLFEWRWDDIADECERFLGPFGYCGVQISPPSENTVVTNPDRPWWERYQPVSYKLVTRSGDENALRDMISRCNKAGVRIYADVVINHMTGAGGSGTGTGGSSWNGGSLSYPAVPYGPNDFNNGNNCHTSDGSIHDYSNPEEVRNCRLVNLADLALGHDYVRGKIADYLNHLIDLGVAGFRVDAAKHMWPGDLKVIFGQLKNLRSDMFGSGQQPFICQEVIDRGGEAVKGEDYLQTGRITNFKFSMNLENVFRRQNPMKYLENWGTGWGMWNGNDVVNFIDNHDNERGHSGGGGGALTFREPRPFKLATAFMLAHPYGFPRILSSFEFSSTDQGPPRNGNDIAHVTVNTDYTCSGGWVCEHRWRQIYNMVAFRNVAGSAPLSHWWSGADYQIAFGRGNKAFIALNLESFNLNANLQTDLPQGTYCDVISGNLENGRCTGNTVHVGGDGRAHFDVCAQCDDPMVAIHVDVRADAGFHDPNCASGRTAITHLFEWRWDDIADECERFLGPFGYCGVQISPPSENAVVTNPYRPWWERYQPVSYKLVTRSGDENDFREMVSRCNNVGVRIYADVVINHMTGAGGSGTGTGGSPWNGGSLSYPAVPYGPNDFNNGNNCHTADGSIHDYNNPEEVRNCRLVSLADLALGHDYVRGKIAGYLNHLIDVGVAGFRVDAAKHMWPGDLKVIFGLLKNLRSDVFGSGKLPFVYQEVIDQGGQAIKGEEYLQTGRITNFKYGLELARVFHRQNPMKYLYSWGIGWGMWNGDDVVNFIDNHDNQRGHGGGGEILTHKNSRPYKLAIAFMLAHPYGVPRIMSSFAFSYTDQGPPSNGSDIAHVTVHADHTCSGGWVCEHRWRQIYNMVAFRNVAGLAPLSYWWSGADYQIAFGRGNKAFIALNLESFNLNANLQTGLPQGTYCDVITGNLENGICTGNTVHVGADGRADFDVCAYCYDPMVAIHVGAKLGSPPKRTE